MSATALPPLIWLRAFDAAGRTGSFKAAAESLHVTPSAISHQIKSLEAHLGIVLFERSGVRLALTASGRAYWEQVALAFEQLRAASEAVQQREAPRVLRVSATPFVANEWLLPLIPAFDAAFPGQSLRLSATEALENPAAGETDFAIRFGQGGWTGVEELPLAPVLAVPATASGAEAAALPRIDYAFHGQTAWTVWRSRGLPLLGRDGGERLFSHFDAAMRATEQGLGVSIAVLPLVKGWLAANRLALVPGIAPTPIGQLSLLSRPLVSTQTTLRAARDWLLQTLRAQLTD